MPQAKSKLYSDYASVLHGIFPERVQKLTVDAGFTCPNRDGLKGIGGCTYCNNQSFSPAYCEPSKPILQQIREGICFFEHKYSKQQYLVYFQSYTNTYAELSRLKSLYEEALSFPNVVGLVIGTRPDCVSNELLDYLTELAKTKYIMVEYGLESTYDETLARINRGHTFGDAHDAILRTQNRNIHIGAHLILGLPGETKEMILQSVTKINALPINALKLHQLQLINGTQMAKEYEQNKESFSFFELEDYLDLLVDFLERLHPQIAIERFVSQSPKDLLILPQWGLKNFEFTAKLEKRLKERNSFQGKLFS